MRNFLATFTIAPCLLLLYACQSGATPEPEGLEPGSTEEKSATVKPKTSASAEQAEPARSAEPAASAAPIASASSSPPLSAAALAPSSPPAEPGKDPHGGKFTLAEATQGIFGTGKLMATLDTTIGTLVCELYDDRAPNTVANFIGLARGTRAWNTPDLGWVKRPLYNGTPFHRIIKGFMIQGGDPLGNGRGGPGFVIPDEIWPGATHNKRGQLCMANRGANTNGSQFFILDDRAPHLDGGYTIFGMCGPDAVIEKLANAPVRGQRAINAPRLKRVSVKRGK